ncbi:MAG: LytTR family transcriptional regulator DNA-binding domain-containing protein, partial [Pedobacter sp.]|nr:LytTR family transcriptional regulator DNA-binding domain-containing protein [Pedobacter sp.]
IHTAKKMFITYMPLKEIQSDLRGNINFIRINRSFLISKNHINKIEGDLIYLQNSITVKRGITFDVEFKTLVEGFRKF